MLIQRSQLKRKALAILAFTVFLVSRSTITADAFGVSSPFHRIESHSASIDTRASTNLHAERNEGDRRGFFSAVRKVFLGAGAVVSNIGSRSLPALAEDTGSSSGNLVEIQIENLDGPSSSGTIKIQLKPEWAPRGVARFEVSVEEFWYRDLRVALFAKDEWLGNHPIELLSRSPSGGHSVTKEKPFSHD
jgi:hypothetical protein